MNKFIFLLIILCIVGVGFLCWWQDRADVRELNKTLPEGIKIVKSLFGEEYKVVNKIDGYEFKVPTDLDGWKKVEKIDHSDVTHSMGGYFPDMPDSLKEIISLETTFEIDGERVSDFIHIRSFYLNRDVELSSFVQEFQNTFYPNERRGVGSGWWIELYTTSEEKMMGDYNILNLSLLKRTSTHPEPSLFGNVYFLKGQLRIFMMEYGEEDLITEVVANGKW